MIAVGAKGRARLPPSLRVRQDGREQWVGGGMGLTTALLRMRLIVKMSILTTLIYKYIATPIKIPAGFVIFNYLVDIGKLILECVKTQNVCVCSFFFKALEGMVGH